MADSPVARVRERRQPRAPLPSIFEKLFFETASGSNAKGVMKHARKNLVRLHASPGVWMIEDFLSEADMEHLDRLIASCRDDFHCSYTNDSNGKRIYSSERTSTFMWFSKGQDTVIRKLETRAADMVGLSSVNVEPIQVVAYNADQHFDEHHDMGTIDENGSILAVEPRRLVTFFVYLNTLPEGRGHTEFTRLGLSVRPVRGSALLFCNVDSAGEPDVLATHRACPVGHGYNKYGLNIWITASNLQYMACASTLERKRKRSERFDNDDVRRGCKAVKPGGVWKC